MAKDLNRFRKVYPFSRRRQTLEVTAAAASTITPTTTDQTWPAAFTTTDPGGVTSWTWTAPDGTDQSANLTDGDGNTSDYSVNGVHVIKALDADSDILAYHEVTLGSSNAVIAGAMTLPDWDTLTKTDPNSIFSNIQSGSYTMENVYISTLSSTWGWLYTGLTVPAGKHIRLYWIGTDAGWTQVNSHQGVFISSDPTDTVNADIHFAGTNFRHSAAPNNRGKPSTADSGAAYSLGSENSPQDACVLDPDTGENGLVGLYSCFGRRVNGDSFSPANNKNVTGNGDDINDIAYVGLCCGRFGAGAAIDITGSVLVVVY